MRTFATRLVLIAVVLTVTAAVASAQQPIRNLRVSLTPDGTHAGTEFPSGTEALYAVFTYSDLADDRIAATIEGRGLAELATSSARMTGSGVGSLELSGAMLYKAVTGRMVSEAEAARDTVNRAAGASVGLQEYLDQILGSAYTMRTLTDYLVDVPISEPMIANTGRARQSLADLEMLVDDALRLSVSDVAGRQAKAEAMKHPIASVITSARQLDQGAASITVAPIAPSPKGNDYTIQASINGLPSSTVDFRISPDTRIFLPSVAKRAVIPHHD